MTNRLARLLCLLSLCSACAGRAKIPPILAKSGSSVSTYVINHGKHAGLAVRRTDIPPGLVPESADFPGVDYLELGWGDWDYYQADDPGLWLTLKAAFWPTASVLHVVGVEGAVADRFGGFEIVRLEVARSRFDDLAAFVHASFLRDGAARAGSIGPGDGRDSLCYPARGRFHIFNTCNTWTARTLEAAGYPMGKLLPFTVEQLMARARRHAEARDGTATPPDSSTTVPQEGR
jgi:uncharacterized protein (TIGR02117 family)